ncbi:MAG TPA: AcvB/VirJ family lysyl-phosphatidylglycerol hydrolase [Thermoanaerobaculia bacterium]
MSRLRPTARRLTACAVLALLLAPGAPAAAFPWSGPSRPKDLPLLELPAKRGPLLAVILSGDGGWTGIDRKIAGELATAHGIAVVGLNSRRYFHIAPKPERAARDLERILRYYLPAWHRQRALLIGYSLGADALPFLATRLPSDLLDKVALIALLSPAKATRLRVEPVWHPGGPPPPPLYQLLPEVESLRGRPLLCLYGEREDDALCPALPSGLAKVVAVPGAHGFKRDFRGVTARILGAVGAGASS